MENAYQMRGPAGYPAPGKRGKVSGAVHSGAEERRIGGTREAKAMRRPTYIRDMVSKSGKDHHVTNTSYENERRKHREKDDKKGAVNYGYYSNPVPRYGGGSVYKEHH